MSRDPLRAQSIFLAAVEKASTDRGALLDCECSGNPELRNRVEALLKAHDNPGSFLDAPPPGIDVPSVSTAAEQPGTVIGPYKLMEQIGEGGFGVVFMAEQERPVRRKVALKIIKPGMDTRQVIGRFEAERQALAMMDHPNIAKVYDAGTTENGRPYFVMELVHGVAITEYCDWCNLSTRERLEIFISVCQSVQHAHQKGVIHRDIKPTNILVAMQDGRPEPKIIDFGVAKALNQRLTEHTLATGFAQMLGTPLYMSPEQAELSPMGVDTRSDIYSLGVLLYELLVGTTPYDKDRLHNVGYDEMRRIIREEEPPRPSARISTLAADLATTVAERRCVDVRRLTQTICGDLDWIVMKCLEKDRTRRYATASELAADVERYLANELVLASPPSATYRLSKFARRNKQSLAIAGLVLLMIVMAAGSAVWIFRDNAAREQSRFYSRRSSMLQKEGNIDEAVASLQTAIQRDPDNADLYHSMGIILVNQGKLNEAIASFNKSIEIDPDWLMPHYYSGYCNARLGRSATAIERFDRAVELNPNDHDLWYLYSVLLLYVGDETAYRAVCENMLKRFSETTNPNIAERTAKTCLLASNSVSDPELVQTLADRVVNGTLKHPDVGAPALAKGMAEYRAGNPEKAIQWLRQMPELDMPRVAFPMLGFAVLAMAHHELGQTDAAVESLAKSRKIFIEFWPDLERGEPFDGGWHDWLRARILLREAEDKLKSKPAQQLSPKTND